MDIMQYKKHIRKHINELRIEKNVTEKQMSLDLGRSRTYINNVVNGRTMPALRQLFEIMDYFEVTPYEFFSAVEKAVHEEQNKNTVT